MAKYTVQNGSVVALNDKKERETHKVGAVLELTPEMAKKMDPTGFYLCPPNKYVKGKTYTPKPVAAVAADADEDEELDEEDLEDLTKPGAKTDPKK